MEGALGIIEIRGLATAITVADVMAKTADVKIVNIERAQGGGWMTIKITGNVAAVNASISAGKQTGDLFGDYVTSKVIPRPAVDVSKLFCRESDAGESGGATEQKAGDKPEDLEIPTPEPDLTAESLDKLAPENEGEKAVDTAEASAASVEEDIGEASTISGQDVNEESDSSVDVTLTEAETPAANENVAQDAPKSGVNNAVTTGSGAKKKDKKKQKAQSKASRKDTSEANKSKTAEADTRQIRA